MPSIKDVAKHANVSIATVSNVVNGTRYVSNELRKKVLTVIDELDYEADHIARSLKSNRTKTIGVLVTSINRIFFPLIIKGIQAAASKYGYNLMLYSLEDSFEKEKEFVKMLAGLRVDGIIIDTLADRSNEEYLKYIAKLKYGKKFIPVVSLERNLEEYGISSVFVDNLAGGKLAVECLIKRGCQKIAFIKGPANSDIALDRFNAYKSTLEKHGLPFDERFVCSGDFSPISGYSETKRLLLNGVEFDGMFASNDQMAIGAIKSIKEHGLKVPDDVKLVGYDNTFVSSIVYPSLTTINVPKYRLGLEAFDILHRLMKSGENAIDVKTVLLPTSLMIRNSTNSIGETNWDMEDW